MPFQPFSGENRAADFGSLFGQGLGQGIAEQISNNLQQLAQQKMMRMQQLQTAQGLFPFFGEQGAMALSRLSPDERKLLLQNPGAVQQLFGGDSSQLEQPQQGLSALQGFQQQQMTPQQAITPEQVAQLFDPFYRKPLSEVIGQAKFTGQAPDITQQEQLANQERIAKAAQEQPRIRAIPQQPQGKSLRLPPTPEERAKLIADAFTSPQEKREREKLDIQRQKLSSKEQQLINKAEKPYIEKISAYKEVADDAEKRLGKMESLINKGGLPLSGFYNLFKNLEESVHPAAGAAAGAALGGALGSLGGPGGTVAGIPVGARIGATIGGLVSPVATLLRSVQRGVTSPNTEQFEKLSADFIKNAKSIFGSRITDADLAAFMQTIPTLSQTDAGKIAIINNMRSFNKASQVRYKAMRDIIRENDGRIPANLEFLVNDRVQPELDRISQEFISA